MPTFLSARKAKEFLVSQIAQQAEHEQAPLSEIERKILAYVECEDSPLDVREVALPFAEKDADECLTRIGNLLVRAYIRMRAESPGELQKWRDSWKILKKQEHVLSAIVGALIKQDPDRIRTISTWTGLSVGAFLVLLLWVEIEFHVLPQWFRDLDLGYLRAPLFVIILVVGLVVRALRDKNGGR